MLAIVSSQEEDFKEGTRRQFDGAERVYYGGYWIKTYPVPTDSLLAKKNLIEALARRLFNHTEHGLNVPGARLNEARAAYEAETNHSQRRVIAGMLAGALFNRATDIFRRLVELQAEGVEIQEDYPLVQECGRCLLEAMDLGRMVLHRSGEEGLEELWGEPFRAFSVPLEAFYESRYIKIAQCMRDIDTIAKAMIDHFSRIACFSTIEKPVLAFAAAARLKAETLRTDANIFVVWSRFVVAGERLAAFAPASPLLLEPRDRGRVDYDLADGEELIRRGRDLIFHIARARVSMPKSTREFVARCDHFLRNGRLPELPTPPPA
jgi:hypothetical protein